MRARATSDILYEPPVLRSTPVPLRGAGGSRRSSETDGVMVLIDHRGQVKSAHFNPESSSRIHQTMMSLVRGRYTPATLNGVAVPAIMAIGAFGAVPADGQAQWNETDVEGGKEFRLFTGAGDAIFLQCLTRGTGAALQFAQPVGSVRGVTMRGIPGGQRNVAVRWQAGGYFLAIASGPGRDFMFRMLRNAASLNVRAGDRELSFDVFGSDQIVSQCLQQQEAAPQD